MLRRSFAVTAVALLVALPLAACSGDGDDGSSALRIGLEAPLSGSQSELGQGMLQGAEMAAAELNAAGGVLGREVEIVAIDDEADPDAGVAAATEAIEDGLDAVVGPYNSGVGVETLPLYITAGLVPMRLTSADSTAGKGFTLQPMTSQIAPVATAAITQFLRADSVALIVDTTTTYTTDAAVAMRTLLTQAGVTITAEIGIEPGGSSYANAITSAAATAPDVVYLIAYYPEAGLIAKEMAESGTSIGCLADYGAYDNGFLAAAGQAGSEFCPVVGVPAPDDFPGSDALVSEFESRFDTTPGAWSPYTYDSVMLLADAIERAGSTEAGQLGAALAATSGWRGWTGTVSFDPPTGNRIPAPVTVNRVVGTIGDRTNPAIFRVDPAWVEATGFTY